MSEMTALILLQVKNPDKINMKKTKKKQGDNKVP